MGKMRFRSCLDDGLFAALIAVGAVAAAGLEMGALHGAMKGAAAPVMAQAVPAIALAGSAADAAPVVAVPPESRARR